MRRIISSIILSTILLAALSAPLLAAENKWEKEAMDAWLDGKAEATLLFNGNLDSFDIDTDVMAGKVTLTGKVSNEVEKELAEELILGIEGVKSVDNRLSVYTGKEYASSQNNSASGQQSDGLDTDEAYIELTDAKISTVVKSRFLFNSEVSGTNINVNVENGIVTLNGEVETDAERDLAVSIAKKASDVKSVNNELTIMKKKAS